MRLKDHPKMKVNGISVWPLGFGGTFKGSTKFPPPEEGILKAVTYPAASYSVPSSMNLVIEYEGNLFNDDLPLQDSAFLTLLHEKLKACIGQSMREIGNMEIDF